MQSKLEWLVKQAFRKWESGLPKAEGEHPDEEDLACFLEGKLDRLKRDGLIDHFLSCEACAGILATQLKVKESSAEELPGELLAKVKKSLFIEGKTQLLEILLKLKENVFELLYTSGDVLVGQELVPAALLSSRQIEKIRDEITVLKDFAKLRVEIKIENKPDNYFDLTVIVKDKLTSQMLKDIRISLMRGDLELASYLTESGKAIFEHIQPGKYTVELFDIEKKLAEILLDIEI